MKMVKVKSAREIVLQGVRAELETMDGSIKSITLTDAGGRMVKVSQDYYTALLVTVPAPPEFQTKYRVTGRYAGCALDPTACDSEQEAEERAASLRNMGVDVEIEPFHVAIDD